MNLDILAFTSAGELAQRWDQAVTIKDFCNLVLVIGVPLLILGIGLFLLKLFFLGPLLGAVKLMKGEEGKGIGNFCSTIGHIVVSVVSLLVIGTLLYAWFCPECKVATRLRSIVGLPPYKKAHAAKVAHRPAHKPPNAGPLKAGPCCGTPVLVASQPYAGGASHRVCRGETLWNIAYRYGTSVEYLMWRNGIRNPHLIYENEILALSD